MQHDLSIASLIINASLLVQLVMLVLLGMSVWSWTLIIAKRRVLRLARRGADQFEERFWSSEDLTGLYNRMSQGKAGDRGMEKIFVSGFREFARLSKRGLGAADTLDGVQRAMRVAITREIDSLETALPFLATVGSVSPYIGLFGTVWGIMNAFQSLGNVGQATLAMVAPGISEALVATAMGLFAAIPAVIAFNRYTAAIDSLYTRYELFMEEFSAILQRQVGT
jgi:biopolymer transport protein TolQ